MIIFLEGFAGFASDGRKENSNQCRWESHGTVLQNGQNNPASEYGFTRGRATPTVCRLVVRRRGVIMPVAAYLWCKRLLFMPVCDDLPYRVLTS